MQRAARRRRQSSTGNSSALDTGERSATRDSILFYRSFMEGNCSASLRVQVREMRACIRENRIVFRSGDAQVPEMQRQSGAPALVIGNPVQRHRMVCDRLRRQECSRKIGRRRIEARGGERGFFFDEQAGNIERIEIEGIGIEREVEERLVTKADSCHWSSPWRVVIPNPPRRMRDLHFLNV